MSFQYDDLVHRIRTPIEVINILGCGGMKMGVLAECWGPPSGGKSTFCYQCAGYFQQDYPEGFLDVFDAENSVDDFRLNKVFGIDTKSPFYSVQPVATIEDLYKKLTSRINSISKEGAPYLAIVDSWTVLCTEKDIEKNEVNEKGEAELTMYASGQMYKPRVAKFYLNMLMTQMYRKPITILIINQATTEITQYGSKVVSGGGYGLKHNIQFGMNFERCETLKTSDDVAAVFNGTKSLVSITKSKFIPEVSEIPIFVNATLGGKIEPYRELMMVCLAKKLIIQSGSWYKLTSDGQSYRWQDLVDKAANEPEFYKSMREKLQSKYRAEYLLVDTYYNELDRRVKLLQAQ